MIATACSGQIFAAPDQLPEHADGGAADSGDASPVDDAGDLVGPRWEAEAIPSSGLQAVSDPAASGGIRMTGFEDAGDYLEIPDLPSGTAVAIRYSLATAGSRQASLYVAGADRATITFSPTGAGSSYALAELQQRVEGTLRLQIDPEDLAANGGAGGPDLDLLFAPYAPATGTTFPVASAAEIADAMTLAQPGDVLVMADGRWTDQEIRLAGHGSPEAPITLRADTPGAVHLDGGSRLEISGSYLVVDGLRFEGGALTEGHVIEFDDHDTHHCRLTNSAVIDYNSSDREDRYFWVSLRGRHNRVDHCYLSGQGHSGVTLVVWLDGQPNYHVIDHNHFAGRPVGTGNGWETIRIGDSSTSLTDSNTVVKYNYFHRCDGENELISNKSCGNWYLYNTFVDNQGHLSLRHGNDCRVEGNFFLDRDADEMGGVRIIGENHMVVNNYFAGMKDSAAIMLRNGIPDSPLNGYFQVKNATVAYNTLVDCDECISIGYNKNDDDTLPPRNSLIANNIVVGDQGPLIQYYDDPIDLTYRGNLVYGADLGIPSQPGLHAADPRLELSAAGLYQLRPDSPAIDAAEDVLPGVLADIGNRLRPELGKDIGAQEYGADALLRPLAPEDVGPAWSL